MEDKSQEHTSFGQIAHFVRIYCDYYFMEYLLSARCCFKCFTHVNSVLSILSVMKNQYVF